MAIFDALFNRKNKTKEKQYLVISLPGDRNKVQNILEKYALSGYEPLNFQTDYNYAVLRRNNMEEETKPKQYKVLELPNNCRGVEQLYNSEYDLGWEVIFTNDYSATFIKREV